MAWHTHEVFNQYPELTDYDLLATDAAPQMKSVGNSVTAAHDVCTCDDAKITLFGLCDSVATRLRRHGAVGQAVQISVRDAALKTFQRQCTLNCATDCSYDLFEAAYGLLMQNWREGKPLRTLGVSVTRLSPASALMQLSFLPEDAKRQRQAMLERTLDDIRERYGYFAIRRAVMLTDEGLGDINPAQEHVLVPEPYFK